MKERPLLIGITGNIGTGKSTVAHMLAELGADVIDADEVAHQVIRQGTPAYEQIVEKFGPEILAAGEENGERRMENGGVEIDRRRLGVIVFDDPEALAQLEAIVHPATLEEVERRIGASAADAVAVEAIKLIEAGMADDCDSVWVTTCRPEQQLRRIMAARDLGRAEAEQRIRAQAPPEEKIARADVVIDNSGSLAQTRAQVEAAWEQLGL